VPARVASLHDLRDPEKSIEQFATPLYKTMTENRRDQARLDLAAVAPPGGVQR
jgi:hypothetical protein